MPELKINFLAVGVAALTTIVIGAVWYSPLMFQKAWMKAHGYSADKIAELQASVGRTFLVSFLCYVVMAVILSVLISHAGVSMVAQGAVLGFLVWLGFLATVGMTAHLFSGKALSTYLIDVGYQLVYTVVMSVILTAWR